jgi:hypothetical protein
VGKDEIGKVGAPDQQHGQRRREQHGDCRVQAGTDQHVGEAVYGYAASLVRPGKCGGEPLSNHVHLRPRVLEGHARFELGAATEPAKIARHVCRLERQRRPDDGGGAIERPLRQHADDGVSLAIQQNVAPDKGWIGPEATLPEHMAQEHDMIVPGLVLPGKERAAERRLSTEDVEVADRETRASNRHRLALAGQRCPPTNLRGHVLEDGVLLRPIEIVERGDAIESTRWERLEDADDALGVGVGEWAEQNAVDEAEHRRVSADRQRDGRNRDGGEARAVAKAANGVVEFVNERDAIQQRASREGVSAGSNV